MHALALGWNRHFSSQLTLDYVRPSLPDITTVSRGMGEVKGIICEINTIRAFSIVELLAYWASLWARYYGLNQAGTRARFP